MKRLVILTDNFLPRVDGIVRFLTEIIPRLRDHYDITVVCPDTQDVPLPKGIDYITIPLSKRKVGDFYFPSFKPMTLLKAIKSADMVFSQTIGPIGGVGLFLAQRFRKKTISYIHSVEWELFPKVMNNLFLKKHAYPLSKKLVRLLYSNCSYLLVPSERIADMLVWQGIKTPKSIIQLGVDTTRFAPLSHRDSNRESLSIKKTDIVIGYHGRMSKEKDIVTLLRAFVKLRKKYSHLKLLLVGGGLPDLIKQFKKQQGVIYLPSQQNVESYVGMMDIFCLPSLTETTSLSTLEAMSSGVAVVSTPVGYVRDYIVEGKTGFFFKQSDSFDLVQKLEPLIHSGSLRSKVGKSAREFVIKNFSWDATAKKLILFFTSHKF